MLMYYVLKLMLLQQISVISVHDERRHATVYVKKGCKQHFSRIDRQWCVHGTFFDTFDFYFRLISKNLFILKIFN